MFHKRGPAAAKHWSLKLLFDLQTTHIVVLVDRSWRVLTLRVYAMVLCVTMCVPQVRVL